MLFRVTSLMRRGFLSTVSILFRDTVLRAHGHLFPILGCSKPYNDYCMRMRFNINTFHIVNIAFWTLSSRSNCFSSFFSSYLDISGDRRETRPISRYLCRGCALFGCRANIERAFSFQFCARDETNFTKRTNAQFVRMKQK